MISSKISFLQLLGLGENGNYVRLRNGNFFLFFLFSGGVTIRLQGNIWSNQEANRGGAGGMVEIVLGRGQKFKRVDMGNFSNSWKGDIPT